MLPKMKTAPTNIMSQIMIPVSLHGKAVYHFDLIMLACKSKNMSKINVFKLPICMVPFDSALLVDASLRLCYYWYQGIKS